MDFTAEDVLRQLSRQGEPWDKAKSFDGSVCLGDWLETAELPKAPADGLTARLLIDGEEKSSLHIADLKAEAGLVIEKVSRFFTLRQGDILLTGQPKEKPLVEVDSHLEGVICGRKLTEFNVK